MRSPAVDEELRLPDDDVATDLNIGDRSQDLDLVPGRQSVRFALATTSYVTGFARPS